MMTFLDRHESFPNSKSDSDLRCGVSPFSIPNIKVWRANLLPSAYLKTSFAPISQWRNIRSSREKKSNELSIISERFFVTIRLVCEWKCRKFESVMCRLSVMKVNCLIRNDSFSIFFVEVENFRFILPSCCSNVFNYYREQLKRVLYKINVHSIWEFN